MSLAFHFHIIDFAAVFSTALQRDRSSRKNIVRGPSPLGEREEGGLGAKALENFLTTPILL